MDSPADRDASDAVYTKDASPPTMRLALSVSGPRGPAGFGRDGASPAECKDGSTVAELACAGSRI